MWTLFDWQSTNKNIKLERSTVRLSEDFKIKCALYKYHLKAVFLSITFSQKQRIIN